MLGFGEEYTAGILTPVRAVLAIIGAIRLWEATVFLRWHLKMREATLRRSFARPVVTGTGSARRTAWT